MTKTPRNPPLKIVILMACYYMADPTVPGWESEAGRKFRADLIAEGMIDTDHNVTARGRAWIKLICGTAQPQ